MVPKILDERALTRSKTNFSIIASEFSKNHLLHELIAFNLKICMTCAKEEPEISCFHGYYVDIVDWKIQNVSP